MNELISIVLPVYNGSQFLAESIESCINQTYTNWELIIVNDCSTDNSLQIADEYASKDNRIRVVNNQINKKLPASLNEGFKFATGKYYTWTSHDNRFHTEFLSKMVTFLDGNSECALVSSNSILINTHGEKLGEFREPDLMKIVLYNPVGAAFLYRADVAKIIGSYDETLFLVEDYDYWIRIWLSFSICHYDEFLYDTRIHSNSLTRTKKTQIQKMLLRLRMNYLESFIQMTNGDDIIIRRLICEVLDGQSLVSKLKTCVMLVSKDRLNMILGYCIIHKPRRVVKSLKSIVKKMLV